MLQVDLYVPSLNKKYNFNLNETALVGTIIEELTEMICQKEQCTLFGEVGELMLVCIERQEVLQKQETLEQYGIITGNRLMLV
ncbi:hypothetical protein [Anaerosporobacter faecicola]|uniref:hypothetical protein n=1 Tax=Anaerosporobacter faecicola TaxID=2718714 RepID=UPI00143C368C|nr:hypothetical protein [Anaerosporobacter faecicola]